MNGRRLLAVMAHPDDESFGVGGTLAKYARQGAEVHVCTVTDGAAGWYDSKINSEAEPLPLAHLRRQELACACKILGAQMHTLDYRDSGVLGAPDNRNPVSLYQADLEDVARDVLHVCGEARPHVVLTHDPTGGYFHPDHIKVNQAVLRAWDRSSETPWLPHRLYYTVLPRSAVKWFVRILWLLRRDPERFGKNKDIDLTRVGVPETQIHVRLDVDSAVKAKVLASACHSSQGGGGAVRVVPAFLRRRFLRYEYFVQARPVGAGPHYDLFEGLGSIE